MIRRKTVHASPAPAGGSARWTVARPRRQASPANAAAHRQSPDTLTGVEPRRKLWYVRPASSPGLEPDAASIGILLYTRAIRQVRALESILILTLEPILNPLWVLLVVGEVPGPLALAGGTIVIGAVVARALAGPAG